jgi:hypothetical protein
VCVCVCVCDVRVIVPVSIQVLGRAMNDNVVAELERLPEHGRKESVVDHSEL